MTLPHYLDIPAPPETHAFSLAAYGSGENNWLADGSAIPFSGNFVDQSGATQSLYGSINVPQGSAIAITGLDAAIAAGWVTDFVVTDVQSSNVIQPTSSGPLTYPCPGNGGLEYTSTWHYAPLSTAFNLTFAVVGARFWTDLVGCAEV
jgi:hypothetical protein